MINAKLLRADIFATSRILLHRGYVLDVLRFELLEKHRHQLQIKTEELRAKRNASSKTVGYLKSIGKDFTILLIDMKALRFAVEKYNNKLKKLTKKIFHFMSAIPNLPLSDVLYRKEEPLTFESKFSKNLKAFSFLVKDHIGVSNNIGYIDASAGTKLASSRFVVMYNNIARLHRAISQFMIDVHTREHNYQEVYVPYLVNQKALFGTGQLPKFSNDLLSIKNPSLLSLIPTSEVVLTNLVSNSIIANDLIPLKFVSYTPCFRSEAGSYGLDTRGILRQHQFDKVELVQIVFPNKGRTALDELVSHAESILVKLDLPYRILHLSPKDMAFSACKAYDIEVWMPGQKTYREISSCSWCSDFQTRRMYTRYKPNNFSSSRLLHTLNGSGLAVGRTLASILENYQQADGSLIIPYVLRKYMGGLKVLR
jgi:seryl-tRNA synthetase